MTRTQALKTTPGEVRFCKTAFAAFVLSAIPLIATAVGAALVWATLRRKTTEGWERFGQGMFALLVSHGVLIGGSIVAGLSVLLGGIALVRITPAKSGLRGKWTAWLAIAVSALWLGIAWAGAYGFLTLVKAAGGEQ